MPRRTGRSVTPAATHLEADGTVIHQIYRTSILHQLTSEYQIMA
jgi:hypothetical protein